MTSDTPAQPTPGRSESGAAGPDPEARDAPLVSQHLDVDALSAYLDQDLSPADREAAAAHLAACPECGRELAELRATVALVQDLPLFAARRDFQLGPDQARRAAAGRRPGTGRPRTGPHLPRGLDRWFDRLLPAYPALRIATAAVALLLVAVIAGDLLVNRGAGDVTMLPAGRGVANAPEAAMPRQAPAVQQPAAFQPTLAPAAEEAEFADQAEFAEPAAGDGTDAARPASLEAADPGAAPGVVAPSPAAEPAPAPSGWRLVQVGLLVALLWLIVTVVGIARVRRERFSAPSGEPDREPRR